jgi:predicted Zn-ribbon and HTH transcriptional regulator
MVQYFRQAKLYLPINYTYKHMLPKRKCQRCGHEWTPRVEKQTICPKCKSPYWNKPRQEKV